MEMGIVEVNRVFQPFPSGMKRFILPTLLCLIAGSLHAKVPNIALMCADNIGYGDLGCYGNIGIKTPRIDPLAAEAALCTGFYVVSST